MEKNGTMIQYFEWYVQPGTLWKQLCTDAGQMAADGITAVWIPPAYKGSAGRDDVGYGVYDLYDLGEFDQKGTVETKYGSKDDLIRAIQSAHDHGLQVYADIVLNHKLGADETETVMAEEFNPENRNEMESGDMQISAWTHFYFPGRNKKYSNFEWHWYHFTGVNYDEKTEEQAIFKFRGKNWARQVDQENGNFDYLMGADIDLNNTEVKQELIRWGKWFLDMTGVDGFRLDAVKHMKFTFYNEWLDAMRAATGRELFSVGEYWNGDLAALKHYIDTTQGALSLFDVPLHFRFANAAKAGRTYDMRTIFDGTLTQDNPLKSVTFLDNHDTQPGQSLSSWIDAWFRPLAYALILLRQTAYPCVFYGDYYGIEHDGIPSMREQLRPLLKARELCAYGTQHDYLDHPNVIGWTMEGSDEHENSVLAVIMSNADGGEKRMYVGQRWAGASFYDCTGNHKQVVVIENDGNGTFKVRGGSVSVWIHQAVSILYRQTLYETNTNVSRSFHR